jgi:hypothetical protein
MNKESLVGLRQAIDNILDKKYEGEGGSNR